MAIETTTISNNLDALPEPSIIKMGSVRELYPNAPRPRDGLAPVLVFFLELAGARKEWVVNLILWTGDAYIGEHIGLLSRWFWSAAYSQCVWCGEFHHEQSFTVERIRGVPRLHNDRDLWPTLYTYCRPCIELNSSVSISVDTHSWCRRCLAWVRACEHLPSDFWCEYLPRDDW